MLAPLRLAAARRATASSCALRATAPKNLLLKFMKLLCVKVADRVKDQTSVAKLVAGVLRDAASVGELRDEFGAFAAGLCEHPKGAL